MKFLRLYVGHHVNYIVAACVGFFENVFCLDALMAQTVIVPPSLSPP